MAAKRGRTITTFGGLFTPVGLDGGTGVVFLGPGTRIVHKKPPRETRVVNQRRAHKVAPDETHEAEG